MRPSYSAQRSPCRLPELRGKFGDDETPVGANLSAFLYDGAGAGVRRTMSWSVGQSRRATVDDIDLPRLKARFGEPTERRLRCESSALMREAARFSAPPLESLPEGGCVGAGGAAAACSCAQQPAEANGGPGGELGGDDGEAAVERMRAGSASEEERKKEAAKLRETAREMMEHELARATRRAGNAQQLCPSEEGRMLLLTLHEMADYRDNLRAIKLLQKALRKRKWRLVLTSKIPILYGPFGLRAYPIFIGQQRVGTEGLSSSRQYRGTSCFCLGPTHPLRMATIWLLEWPGFEVLSMIAVMSNCALLAIQVLLFSWAPDRGGGDDRQQPPATASNLACAAGWVTCGPMSPPCLALTPPPAVAYLAACTGAGGAARVL